MAIETGFVGGFWDPVEFMRLEDFRCVVGMAAQAVIAPIGSITQMTASAGDIMVGSIQW